MYRLNCHLSDDLGDRLGNYCERSGMLKVAVVAMALDQYLNEQEAKRKLLEQLSDPMKLTEICKIVGVSVPGSKQ
jgi:predicted transcriptional regulator